MPPISEEKETNLETLQSMIDSQASSISSLDDIEEELLEDPRQINHPSVIEKLHKEEGLKSRTDRSSVPHNFKVASLIQNMTGKMAVCFSLNEQS